MSIFDFFTTETTRGSAGRENSSIGKPINTRTSNGSAMQVFHPHGFGDLQSIIEILKKNQSAVVYLNNLKQEDAQRALDVLSGAIFALDGSVLPVEKGIYIFTLDGVTLRK